MRLYISKADRHRKARDFLPSYNDALFLCDILGGVVVGYISGLIYIRYAHPGLPVHSIIGPLSREVMLGSVIAALVLREPRLAIGRELFAPRRLLACMLWRAVATMAILLTIGLATRGLQDMARLWLFGWCALLLLFMCISRVGIVAYLHHLAMGGALREAVAVIGAPDVAGRLAERLAEDAAIVKVIDDLDDGKFGTEPSDAMGELLEMARMGAVDTVVVVIDPARADHAQPIVQHFKSVPVQVTLCSAVHAQAISRRDVRLLSKIPMAVVADRPLRRWDLLGKGIMDKVGGLLLLTLAMPLMAALALAVACDSPGPVIFRQRRSGWSGRLFTIYKFRTMWHAQTPSARQTSRNDPRCTRVGALLRRTSLDELPQLWNVVRGDMSLVGPRPHADMLHAAECAACSVVAEYAQRQRVKPGLTGWAQINGARGAASTVEMLRQRITYDLYYIDNWSIWFDVLIIVRTPWIMIRGENAF